MLRTEKSTPLKQQSVKWQSENKVALKLAWEKLQLKNWQWLKEENFKSMWVKSVPEIFWWEKVSPWNWEILFILNLT